MSFKKFINICLLHCFLLMFSCSNAIRPDTILKAKNPPNVLFIAIDDLRPELGCYGNKIVHSPRLDKIAAEGFLFTNHFTQVPTCGPSRYCLLTGMRPKAKEQLRNDIASKLISNQPERELPETFIHHLKRNGYYTVGMGKISHSADGYLYGYTDSISTKRELPYSWDELLFDNGKWETGWNSFFAYANGENRQSLKKQVKPYESGEVNELGYPDGLTANLAVEKLKELKQKNQPFFMGVGFFKPHLPFNAPKKYWDLYDQDSIPISANPELPKNVHLLSLHSSGEFNQYRLGEEKASLDKSVSPEYAKKLKHAYYACISYIDDQVGKIMDELEALDLADNTIIVIWGDHGWHLGDQRVWGKHTLFENALKSTLIMKIPTMPATNKVVKSVVETVDIYPTILELTNRKIEHAIDGESFVQLIKENDSDTKEEVAYGYFKNGITLRTKQYRLTKYYRDGEPKIELYDHQIDPYESHNIALENKEIVEQLMPVLDKGNEGIYD